MNALPVLARAPWWQLPSPERHVPLPCAIISRKNFLAGQPSTTYMIHANVLPDAGRRHIAHRPASSELFSRDPKKPSVRARGTGWLARSAELNVQSIAHAVVLCVLCVVQVAAVVLSLCPFEVGSGGGLKEPRAQCVCHRAHPRPTLPRLQPAAWSRVVAGHRCGGWLSRLRVRLTTPRVDALSFSIPLCYKTCALQLHPACTGTAVTADTGSPQAAIYYTQKTCTD
jgi:hypothetical protein